MSAGMWKARGGSWIQRASIQPALPISSFFFTDSTCVHTPALVKVGRTSFFCFLLIQQALTVPMMGKGLCWKPRHRVNKGNVQSTPLWPLAAHHELKWPDISWWAMFPSAGYLLDIQNIQYSFVTNPGTSK